MIFQAKLITSSFNSFTCFYSNKQNAAALVAGAMATNILQVAIENKGISWSIGITYSLNFSIAISNSN